MTDTCDNKSVGVMLINPENKLLLIDRARFPFALAPPAGHIDNHGSDIEAAIAEVREEVGIQLEPQGLAKVMSEYVMDNNQCRRSLDGWHSWSVFVGRVGNVALTPSEDEVLRADWYDKRELLYLIDSTNKIEDVWLRIFVRSNILSRLG